MSKRDLFTEISQGFDDLKQARDGKKELRTHQIEVNNDRISKKAKNNEY
jgi:hypothetical protein